MGIVLRFPRHATASAGSGGYKSGRNSCRGTPDTRSTASTRSGGTSSHCEIACLVMPSAAASFDELPAASNARLSASLESVMIGESSIASPESQASPHCSGQGALYAVLVTLGQRIKLARTRRDFRQEDLADLFNITKQAVSGWERDREVPDVAKLPRLARKLEVSLEWLLDGTGEPKGNQPSPLDGLTPTEQAAAIAFIETLRRLQRPAA